MKEGGGVLKTVGADPAPPPQRADGYAMGGGLWSSSPNTTGSGATGGATGGAYGGAWSQSGVDGSNWVVATGMAQASGTGTSGGNGGMSPTQTNAGPGGVSPHSPFSMPSVPGPGGSGISSGYMMLAAFGLLAFLMVKK